MQATIPLPIADHSARSASALASLAVVARCHGVQVDAARLARAAPRLAGSADGLLQERLLRLARGLGLSACQQAMPTPQGEAPPLPAIVMLKSGRCVVLADWRNTVALVLDTQTGEMLEVDHAALLRICTGILVVLGRPEVLGGCLVRRRSPRLVPPTAQQRWRVLRDCMARPVVRFTRRWQVVRGASVTPAGHGMHGPQPSGWSGGGLRADGRASWLDTTPLTLPVTPGRLQVQGLACRSPHPAMAALRDVHFHVQAREVIGVVGGPGSGAATLAALLQRQLVPSAGRILVDGVDLHTVSAAVLPRLVATVQAAELPIGASLRDCIAADDRAATFQRVVDAAKLAGVHHTIQAMPEGYRTLVGTPGQAVSARLRLGIALARAVLADPCIVIVEQASSALNDPATQTVRQALHQVAHARTVLILDSQLHALRDVDRVLVFDRGMLLEVGSFDSLAARQDGVFARLLEIQRREAAARLGARGRA